MCATKESGEYEMWLQAAEVVVGRSHLHTSGFGCAAFSCRFHGDGDGNVSPQPRVHSYGCGRRESEASVASRSSISVVSEGVGEPEGGEQSKS